MSGSQRTADLGEIIEIINELDDEELDEVLSSLDRTDGLGWDSDMTLREQMKQKLKEFDEISESEFDGNIHRPGTLLSDKIHYFAEHHNLIFPYDSDYLRAAGYNLRVGDSYAKNGETHDLIDDRDPIEIPPFQVVVIKTREVMNMPRFLIGRLNIKVGRAHEGLLWVGGPHVDPGYVGHLFCPIYNLSSNPVELSKGDEFGVIDFETTTIYNKDADGLQPYPRPPEENQILEDYGGARLESGLWTEAGQRLNNIEERLDKREKKTEERLDKREKKTEERLDEMEEEVGELGTIFYSSISGIFTVLAILIAALSIFVSAGSGSSAVIGSIPVRDLVIAGGGVVVVFGILIIVYVGALKKL